MIRLTPGWKPGDDDVYEEEEEEEETEDEEEEEEEEETNDRASKPSSYEEIAEKKRQLFVRRNEEIQRKTALQNASSMSYSAHDLLKSMDEDEAGMTDEAKAFLSMKPLTTVDRQKNKVFVPGIREDEISGRSRVRGGGENFRISLCCTCRISWKKQLRNATSALQWHRTMQVHIIR